MDQGQTERQIAKGQPAEESMGMQSFFPVFGRLLYKGKVLSFSTSIDRMLAF